MSFRIIKPSRTRLESSYLGDKVKVGFPTINKVQQLLIYIGKDVVKKFGLKKGDRVVLLVDEARGIWQVKKDDEGYKLGEIKENLKLQITWREEIPNNMSKSMQFIEVDVGDGNLQLNLPASNK